MPSEITIRNARLHNLKNITLSIPKNRLVVLTGLSGSGKSTLAFDILHKEGQRQYLESLGMVTYGLSKPPVDSIIGLSPIDQRGPAPDQPQPALDRRHGHRSVHLPACACSPASATVPAPPAERTCRRPPTEFAADGLGQRRATDATRAPARSYPCPHCGAPVPEMGMANFSFNKPEGACPTCTGLGTVHQADLERLVDESKSILDGAVHGWDRVPHHALHARSCRTAGQLLWL